MEPTKAVRECREPLCCSLATHLPHSLRLKSWAVRLLPCSTFLQTKPMCVQDLCCVITVFLCVTKPIFLHVASGKGRKPLLFGVSQMMWAMFRILPCHPSYRQPKTHWEMASGIQRGHLRAPTKLKLNVWLSWTCYPRQCPEVWIGLGCFGSCENSCFLAVSWVERGSEGKTSCCRVFLSHPASCSLSFTTACLKRPKSDNYMFAQPCSVLWTNVPGKGLYFPHWLCKSVFSLGCSMHCCRSVKTPRK